ncbi:MAG: hypothetical protein O3B21_12000 [Proteobacteria bacterium]|nr:hypothetical protein [Pseudomonadota bacterium]MDA1356350.1 hypothetical protein [Pseudomonadota bacterium]
MAITSMGGSFTRRANPRPTAQPTPWIRRSGALAGDILSGLQIWAYAIGTQMTGSRVTVTPRAAPKARKARKARRTPSLGVVNDHLLRDIGFNRLGVRETTLANHNEAD